MQKLGVQKKVPPGLTGCFSRNSNFFKPKNQSKSNLKLKKYNLRFKGYFIDRLKPKTKSDSYNSPKHNLRTNNVRTEGISCSISAQEIKHCIT